MTSLAQIELHHALPRLQTLLEPRGPMWTPAELRGLTRAVSAELRDPLLGILRFASPDRWWTRLALTEEVEVWLLSWLPGQGTRPHDHGGAAGSFTVLTGELAETYRYPSGPIRNLLHTTGSALGFGSGRAHRMQNLGPARASSVHAYSPPLIPTREYASLRDIPGEIPPPPTRRPLAALRLEPLEP
jgi:cysteine dioxygenase type I